MAHACGGSPAERVTRCASIELQSDTTRCRSISVNEFAIDDDAGHRCAIVLDCPIVGAGIAAFVREFHDLVCARIDRKIDSECSSAGICDADITVRIRELQRRGMDGD